MKTGFMADVRKVTIWSTMRFACSECTVGSIEKSYGAEETVNGFCYLGEAESYWLLSSGSLSKSKNRLSGIREMWRVAT